MTRLAFIFLFLSLQTYGATIAIIDTGFDLDHDFLKPKVFKQETDEEALDPELKKEFSGWKFHDNSHLKTPAFNDQSTLQEILLFRTLKAKGHREGLSLEEFEWYKKRNSDKDFMENFKKFKKHSHGTFVAGIALREGENINIFPIRGLHIPVPVVAVEAPSEAEADVIKSKTPEEKFRESMQNSIDRISRKFTKICHYLSLRRIEVVNASYGITHKNIMTQLREKYRNITGQEISDAKLEQAVDYYFKQLYSRGRNTIKKYPSILFVFSAGNSGIDNDQFHHYPSRIKLPNTMSVAAMNGDYLASFSNYGLTQVDVGAPGVAILSVVPKVYSQDGSQIYSPSSGTSMAAPYVSNLAAQILNANEKLKPLEIKKIIFATGDDKDHLKNKLFSGATVNNSKAIKAALLSKEMPLEEAIALAKSDLIPMEDKINFSMTPAVAGEKLKQKVMDTLPRPVRPEEVDEAPSPIEEEIPAATSTKSSLRKNPVLKQPDSSKQPPAADPSPEARPADPVPSSQSAEQSPLPSGEQVSSSSPVEPPAQEIPAPASEPSSP